MPCTLGSPESTPCRKRPPRISREAWPREAVAAAYAEPGASTTGSAAALARLRNWRRFIARLYGFAHHFGACERQGRRVRGGRSRPRRSSAQRACRPSETVDCHVVHPPDGKRACRRSRDVEMHVAPGPALLSSRG